MEGLSASSSHIRILHTLSYFRGEAAETKDRPELAPIRNLSEPFSLCAVFLVVTRRLLRCPTGPLQPLNSDSRPDNVVPGKFLRQKCQKNAAHDTTLAIRRELTKSNLFPAQRKNSADRSVSNPTGAEQALNGNRGRRFQIARLSRRAIRLISTLGKRSTVLFCALKRETRPEQFQLARALWKKRARNSFLETRECSSEEDSHSKVGAWDNIGDAAGSHLRNRCLEGWSGVVVLVEYLSLVDAHDPV